MLLFRHFYYHFVNVRKDEREEKSITVVLEQV